MNVLIDANLPYSLTGSLEQVGKTNHLRDFGLERASDEQVIEVARKHKAVLVTRDLEFGNHYLFPPEKHFGVIIIRVPRQFKTADIIKTVEAALPQLLILKLKSLIIVIEPGGRLRIRKWLARN